MSISSQSQLKKGSSWKCVDTDKALGEGFTINDVKVYTESQGHIFTAVCGDRPMHSKKCMKMFFM